MFVVFILTLFANMKSSIILMIFNTKQTNMMVTHHLRLRLSFCFLVVGDLFKTVLYCISFCGILCIKSHIFSCSPYWWTIRINIPTNVGKHGLKYFLTIKWHDFVYIAFQCFTHFHIQFCITAKMKFTTKKLYFASLIPRKIKNVTYRIQSDSNSAYISVLQRSSWQ